MSALWSWRGLDPLTFRHGGVTVCLVNEETNAYSNDDYWTWHGDLKEGVKVNVCTLSDR